MEIIILKKNILTGIFGFLSTFLFFIAMNTFKKKTERRMINEFKSKIILLDAYIKEIEEAYKYKIIETEKDKSRKLDDEIEFINLRTKEIIRHITNEMKNKNTLYKISIKEFETFLNRLFYT